MRAFLEAYWERGLRREVELINLLGNLSRGVWADGGPGDPAMWSDWNEAVAQIRSTPGSDKLDPL